MRAESVTRKRPAYVAKFACGGEAASVPSRFKAASSWVSHETGPTVSKEGPRDYEAPVRAYASQSDLSDVVVFQNM